jgi:predicted RNA methylase
MLRLAGVGPSDTVYDLGCGDGRILVLAAGGVFNARRCVGVELDPELAEQARRAVSAAGLADRIEVVCGDAAAADVSAATVVALYLSSRGNESLIASIAPRLRPGTVRCFCWQLDY